MLTIFHDALSRKNYKINDFSRMNSGAADFTVLTEIAKIALNFRVFSRDFVTTGI